MPLEVRMRITLGGKLRDWKWGWGEWFFCDASHSQLLDLVDLGIHYKDAISL